MSRVFGGTSVVLKVIENLLVIIKSLYKDSSYGLT